MPNGCLLLSKLGFASGFSLYALNHDIAVSPVISQLRTTDNITLLHFKMSTKQCRRSHNVFFVSEIPEYLYIVHHSV